MGIRNNIRQLNNKKMTVAKPIGDIADYTLPESDEELLNECQVQVFRSSGPGGQSVNTTDSAVRLIHAATGVVITNQDERSQLMNKKRAVVKLRLKIEELQFIPKERHPTKVSRSAKEKRLEGKKIASDKKQQRTKPTRFEE